MKLSDYAKQIGVSYITAWRMWNRGELKATQLSTGTIIVDSQIQEFRGAVVYARVSSSENKSNLDTQALRMTQYANSKGYQVLRVIKEVGSGVNDNRRKLSDLLNQDDYSTIVVEHKDRLTRVGFNYLKLLLAKRSIEIDVANIAIEETSDLMQDFVSIITSFCARLYSIRRRTRKTQLIKECLNEISN